MQLWCGAVVDGCWGHKPDPGVAVGVVVPVDESAAVGAGVVDWVGQFRALAKDGYHHAVSLETHWRGAGTPEASTRVSMQGMKSTLSKAGLNC